MNDNSDDMMKVLAEIESLARQLAGIALKYDINKFSLLDLISDEYNAARDNARSPQ